jgi:hypothetical protein
MHRETGRRKGGREEERGMEEGRDRRTKFVRAVWGPEEMVWI